MEDAEKSSVAEAWTSPEHTTAPQSSPPPAAAGEKLDWQERLDTLQSHHKLESFQQQREHLEQLQSFREQLLLDLSTQVSAGASTGKLSTLLVNFSNLKTSFVSQDLSPTLLDLFWQQ